MAIRIPKDESEAVEFKPSLSDPERIVEILALMANLKGGTIYVGVRRGKNGQLKIFDIDLGKRSIESLINKITDNTEPVIYPRVKVETVSQKKILIIQVDEGSAKPYTAFGRPFKRVGKVTKRMGRDEFECLLRETKYIYYGALPCKEAKIGDLDIRKITEYLTLCKYSRGIPVDLKLPIKENLQKLRVINHSTDNPTRAAILLFGRDPQGFLTPSNNSTTGKGRAQQYGVIL